MFLKNDEFWNLFWKKRHFQNSSSQPWLNFLSLPLIPLNKHLNHTETRRRKNSSFNPQKPTETRNFSTCSNPTGIFGAEQEDPSVWKENNSQTQALPAGKAGFGFRWVKLNSSWELGDPKNPTANPKTQQNHPKTQPWSSRGTQTPGPQATDESLAPPAADPPQQIHPHVHSLGEKPPKKMPRKNNPKKV